MLKWSKHRHWKNADKEQNSYGKSRSIAGNKENISNQLVENNSAKDVNYGPTGFKMTKSMVEQETALAEARRRFNAQVSSESFLTIPNSSSTPTNHLEIPSHTWQRSSVTPSQSDNVSLASSTSFARREHSNSNTLEKRSVANSGINFSRTGNSNTSTLERAGAKSKYPYKLTFLT